MATRKNNFDTKGLTARGAIEQQISWLTAPPENGAVGKKERKMLSIREALNNGQLPAGGTVAVLITPECASDVLKDRGGENYRAKSWKA